MCGNHSEVGWQQCAPPDQCWIYQVSIQSMEKSKQLVESGPLSFLQYIRQNLICNIYEGRTTVISTNFGIYLLYGFGRVQWNSNQTCFRPTIFCTPRHLFTIIFKWLSRKAIASTRFVIQIVPFCQAVGANERSFESFFHRCWLWWEVHLPG